MDTRRLGIATLVATLFLCIARSAAFAQLTVPNPAPSTPPGIRQEGIYVTAPVFLDGALLFRIAVLLNGSPNQLPIQVRREYVETALGEVLATTGSGAETKTLFDPHTLRVHVKREGNVSLLEVVDAKHTDPLPLVTVTPTDAAYYQTTVDALAAQWQSQLQAALIRSLEIRQPAAERHALELVLRAAGILVVVSVVVWRLMIVLRRRIERLEAEIESRDRAIEAQQSRVVRDQGRTEKARRRFLALELRAIEPSQRLTFYVASAEIVLWLLALAWFLATMWAFSLFPQTTSLGQRLAHSAFAVVTTVIVAGLVNRVLDVIIVRIARAWRLAPFRHSEDRARELLRIPTIARALSGFKTFVIVFVAVLSVLGQIGVPIGSVVTIGGLAAVALSLAAQNFIRDFFNGFLVLLEDQYVVGDYVTINTYSGVVEKLTLRMVQVRDIEGNLITIPHSAVTHVVNQSRNWSRVNYRLPVDPNADIHKAIDLVRAAIDSLARDEHWSKAVLEPIEWIGIDELSRDSVVLRASIKTAPLRQFELRRQLNERVRRAFAEANIPFGAPTPAQ
jgi:small-conductance mechanosensitive channel